MATNVGSQVVSVRYHRPVDSSIVNERHRDIRPTGIYKGGYLKTADGGVTWSLTPLVCEIKGVDISSNLYQVKVETNVQVDGLTITNGNYLVLQWAYTGLVDTDFLVFTDIATPGPYDLVVGKRVGATIVYDNRSVPEVFDLHFKVTPDPLAVPPFSGNSNVWVKGGRAYAGTTQFIKVADQSVSLAAYVGTTAIVYLTDTGGVAASNVAATYGGKVLLASVAVPASGIILESHITDARCFLTFGASRIEVRSSDPSGGDLYNGRIWLRS